MSKCGDRAHPAQDEENMVNEDKSNANTALEHYLKSGQQFGDGEKFYLLGFEAALHARNRCKEFDQIASEMASDLEELQQQYPGAAVEEPFSGLSAGTGILPAPLQRIQPGMTCAETVTIRFLSLPLAPACWAPIFFQRYLNLDDVLRSTSCPAAGIISLTATHDHSFLPSKFRLSLAQQ